MKEEEFNALMERFEERQDAALETRDEIPEGETARREYFLGKKIGLAEAIAILEEVDEE